MSTPEIYLAMQLRLLAYRVRSMVECHRLSTYMTVSTLSLCLHETIAPALIESSEASTTALTAEMQVHASFYRLQLASLQHLLTDCPDHVRARVNTTLGSFEVLLDQVRRPAETSIVDELLDRPALDQLHYMLDLSTEEIVAHISQIHL